MKKMEEKGKRPNCPFCGVASPVSNSMNWWCKSCGRQWIKRPCPRRPPSYVGPPCEECGSKRVSSNGNLYWRCHDCGKQTNKIRRRQKLSTDVVVGFPPVYLSSIRKSINKEVF